MATLLGNNYLLWIETVEGGGGQAPIFYNLPMAGAALLTLGAMDDPRRRTVRGAGAMALVGLAIQIKYTAVFEGACFGLTLALAAFRHGTPRRAMGVPASCGNSSLSKFSTSLGVALPMVSPIEISCTPISRRCKATSTVRCGSTWPS